MPIFGYEIKRLLNKRNLLILISLTIITLYLDYTGIIEYKNFQVNKKAFLQCEKNKINRYITYDQYGGYGFRIFFEPSPLIVFWETNKILKSLESNIDMSEIIGIYDIYKGRSIFNEGNYKDFGGCIYLLGSLYMFYMGFINFKNFRFMEFIVTHKNILRSIISRLIILDLIFILIFLFNYFYVVFNGIPISPGESIIFLNFCVYAVLFLDLIYGVGLLTFFIFKTEKFFLSATIWFFLIIILPEINNLILIQKSNIIPSTESLNTKKVEILMKAEKKIQQEVQKMKEKNKDIDLKSLFNPVSIKYWGKIFNENQKRESEFNDIVLKIVKFNEQWSLSSPSVFYQYLTSECSSKGYNGYKDFTAYIFSIRENFFKFYIEKRYITEDTKIEPFLKNEENIFRAHTNIPKNFRVGLALTALYTFFIILVCYFIIDRRLREKKNTLEPGSINPHPGIMCLVLCENDQFRDMIFNYYKQKSEVVCVDYIKGEEIDPGTDLRTLFQYLCRLLGANTENARKNLEELGITNLDDASFHSAEKIKKIYCAALLAVEGKNTFVFKDYLKCESRDFESKLIGLLKNKLEKQSIIIYLTSEKLQVNSPLAPSNISVKVNKYQGFELADPYTYILR